MTTTTFIELPKGPLSLREEMSIAFGASYLGGADAALSERGLTVERYFDEMHSPLKKSAAEVADALYLVRVLKAYGR